MSALPGPQQTAAASEDWPALFALLDAALDLDPSHRSQWLTTLAPDQVRHAPVLERLLQAHAQVATGDFLRTPPTFVFDGREERFAVAAGALIGPYRLLREIGRGGMASVWLAERADGLLARRIALKLPHVSWGAAGFADRMARERNILASLTHPNIARLYDAGVAEDGRPFLALEYVDGVPIDQHVAREGLPLRARIELVVQVARAVAHAHARLVVHRDLKPSNILVDATGQAHLLDFGIAKLIDPAPGDVAFAPFANSADAAATQAWSRALTPDYASPEQIRGDAIGTASDVYSLGVVMFELLAGERPYRLDKGLGAVALAEALERIEPPRASTVAADTALRRQLAGDLDAILARTLAKPAAERYATMAALADDLERHLRGEPVQARPDSRWYRAERWVRRHKLESAIVAALLVAALGGAYAQVLVMLALGIGAAVALWQRNRARRETERARSALARAEQVKGFIASIFTQAVPRAGHGGAVTAADLLQAAAQRVTTDLAGQPEVAAELGALIGASFNELGEVRAGLDWLPIAVDCCTRALGATHRLTLQSRWRLVEAANSVGELTISEPLLAPLLRDLRRADPPEPALLVAALRSDAFVHTKRAREDAAMAALHEAVAIGTAQLGEAHEDTLTARASLSNTFGHFGRNAEALQAIAPAVAPARATFGRRRPHPMLTTIERCHGDTLARNDRPREAIVLLEQALADQRALDADETNRVRVVMTLLAYAHQYAGQFDAAEALLAQADALHRRLTGGVNHEAVQLASGRSLLAVLRGDAVAALAHVAHAEALAAQGLDPEVHATGLRCMRVLAHAAAGDDALAEAGYAALEPRFADAPASMRVRLWRAAAMVRRRCGDAAGALARIELALAVVGQGRCSGIEHGLVLAEAARCRLAAGDRAAAEASFGAALSAWTAAQVDGSALFDQVAREREALRTTT